MCAGSTLAQRRSENWATQPDGRTVLFLKVFGGLTDQGGNDNVAHLFL